MVVDILNSIDIGIIQTNKNLEIEFINRWIEQQSGKKLKEVSGNKLEKAFPEINTPKKIKHYHRALKGESVVLSYRFHEPFFLFSSPLPDSPFENSIHNVKIVPLFKEGSVVGTLTIVEDVTSRVIKDRELRKQLEELEKASGIIKEKEELYRTIVENIGEIIITLDENFIIKYVSPSVSKILGIEAEELVGSSFLRLTHPEDSRTLLESFTRIHGYKDFSRTCEVRLKNSQGEWQPFEMVFNTVLDGGQKGVITISLRDITSRVELQLELLNERNFSRTIIEIIPTIIVVTDKNGDIIKVNNALEELLGLTSKSLLGKPVEVLLNFVPKEELEHVRDVVKSTKGNCTELEWENSVISSSGITKFVRWNTRIIKDYDGKVKYGIITGVDITDLTRAKQELVESKEQILKQLKALEERTKALELLSELNEVLMACSNETEIKDALFHFIPLFSPLKAGRFLIFDKKEFLLRGWVCWGESVENILPIKASECWALKIFKLCEWSCLSENPVLCSHLRSDVECHIAYCLPVHHGSETMGVLSIYLEGDQDEKERTFFRQVLTTIARTVALTLGNVALRNELYEQSIRDPLTGLYNRRYLMETMMREHSRAVRKGMPISVMIVDIDNFKEFNDRYGHVAGDSLLKHVGLVIRQHIRLSDIPCRYGGEEFLIVFPEMKLENAVEKAENLRTLISKQAIFPTVSVTVSIGVASFPEHGATMDEVIARADEALYKAKRTGKNKVVVSGK